MADNRLTRNSIVKVPADAPTRYRLRTLMVAVAAAALTLGVATRAVILYRAADHAAQERRHREQAEAFDPAPRDGTDYDAYAATQAVEHLEWADHLARMRRDILSRY